MSTYTVEWKISVDKTAMNDPASPLEAAMEAWSNCKHTDSIANIFTVIDDEDPGRRFTVDLAEEGTEAVQPAEYIEDPRITELENRLAMMIRWAELSVKPQLGENFLPRGFERAKALLQKKSDA